MRKTNFDENENQAEKYCLFLIFNKITKLRKKEEKKKILQFCKNSNTSDPRLKLPFALFG